MAARCQLGIERTLFGAPIERERGNSYSRGWPAAPGRGPEQTELSRAESSRARAAEARSETTERVDSSQAAVARIIASVSEKNEAAFFGDNRQ